MTEQTGASPHNGVTPSRGDAEGELSYDERAAAATEAVRQLTAYFQSRE